MRWKGDKAKAWEEVKAWTRRTWKDCYTCGRKDLEGINAQAGHYQTVAVVGSNNALAWNPDFIRLQCSYCNGVGQGQQVLFRAHLVREHGEEKVAKYDKEVYGKVSRPIKDWQAIINQFKSL